MLVTYATFRYHPKWTIQPNYLCGVFSWTCNVSRSIIILTLGYLILKLSWEQFSLIQLVFSPFVAAAHSKFEWDSGCGQKSTSPWALPVPSFELAFQFIQHQYLFFSTSWHCIFRLRGVFLLVCVCVWVHVCVWVWVWMYVSFKVTHWGFPFHEGLWACVPLADRIQPAAVPSDPVFLFPWARVTEPSCYSSLFAFTSQEEELSRTCREEFLFTATCQRLRPTFLDCGFQLSGHSIYKFQSLPLTHQITYCCCILI